MKQLFVLFCLSGILAFFACTPSSVDNAKEALLKAIQDEQVSADGRQVRKTIQVGQRAVVDPQVTTDDGEARQSAEV